MSVPRPWTHMEVSEKENGYSVKVWGRTYTFDGSIFPTSIVSLGDELLQEPINLKMDFGHGEEVPYNFEYDIAQADTDKVVVNAAALCGNIILNAAVTLEYDGFVKINLRFVPCGVVNKVSNSKLWRSEWGYDPNPILQSARIVIPMKKDTGSLLHYWPVSNADTVTQSSHISSGNFFDADLPFKPSVWVGNEKYGLNFCMETDQQIQLTDPAKCVQTRGLENSNEVSVWLLTKTPRQWAGREESWYDPMSPVCYELMFHATPVKPQTREMEDDWRIYRTKVGVDDYDKVASLGTKWLMFHEEWSLVQNYTWPTRRKQFKEEVAKCRDLGMKVMLYYGYEYSSAMLDFEKNMDSYLNKNAEGGFTGGWTRLGTYQKAYIACYRGGYGKEFVDAAIRAMDELGIDGIFTDGTFIPWGCANEAHGCGYRDEAGKLHVTYPILSLRETVRRLTEEVHKRGGRVDAHQSGCCVMPVLSFCDSYWDGENLQDTLKKNLRHLSLDAFRCEFYGKNLGIQAQMIAYLQPPEYTNRNIMSITLLHDVQPRAIDDMEMLAELAKIWEAYDDFAVSRAKWTPYWENASSVKSANPNVYVSTFERESKVLAIVSKFEEGTSVETLEVPAYATRVHEVFDDRDYPVVDGKIQCEMKSATVYLFKIC